MEEETVRIELLRKVVVGPRFREFIRQLHARVAPQVPYVA